MEKLFIKELYQIHKECPNCPSPALVARFFNEMLGFLFPSFSAEPFSSEEEFEQYFQMLKSNLGRILSQNTKSTTLESAEIANKFFEALPAIYVRLTEDITAMFEGDPAAKSRHEIVRSYPGFYAVAAYRLAHELHTLGVGDVPRIITEAAHSKTGIDIHPGATIGRYFCIDHGTGVVIGETTVIGDRVKVYQGVTLGALSVNKEDAIRKRHPTIEDNVVIYAGATILGGTTVVGHHSVIGGNVWLTRSVPPFSKVYYQSKMYNGDTDQTDTVVFRSDKEQ